MNNKEKAIKRTAIICGIIFAIVVAYALISWIITFGKVKVNIVYAPFEAVVMLNGNVLKNNSEHYLAPGVYDLEVAFSNFETLTQKVEIKNDTKNLFGSLEAENEEGVEYAKNHLNDFLAVEGIAGEIASEEGLSQRKKLLQMAPVIAHLPVKNSLFVISYSEADDGKIEITISTSDTYMDEAVRKFKSLLSEGEAIYGYDIEFMDFENLLEGNFRENEAENPRDYLIAGFGGVDNFNIVDEGEKDNYYYATITTGTMETYSLMTYRVVLMNVDEKWMFAGAPKPILTQFNTDDVPTEILNLVNQM